MDKLQLVKSERFGEAEADIYSDGDDMYMTINQLAECLEYSDKSGVQKIVDRNPYLNGAEFSGTDNLSLPRGGTQLTRIFTEDGIYEVTMLSRQPKAREFRAWIRGILKALRKGSIKAPSADPSAKLRADAMKMNAATRRAKFLLGQMVEAGIDPKHRLIALAQVYESDGFPVSLPPMETEDRTYDLTEMADLMGVVSKSGNPHAQAVGAIVDLINPDESECVRVPFQRNGHSAETLRYKESVFEDVKKWLRQYDYPNPIPGRNGKEFKVIYRGKAL